MKLENQVIVKVQQQVLSLMEATDEVLAVVVEVQALAKVAEVKAVAEVAEVKAMAEVAEVEVVVVDVEAMVVGAVPQQPRTTCSGKVKHVQNL